MIVYGPDGKYLMEKSKWPSLMLPAEKDVLDNNSMGVLSQETTLMAHIEVNGSETLGDS